MLQMVALLIAKRSVLLAAKTDQIETVHADL